MNKEKKNRLMVLFILFVFLGSSLSYAMLYVFPVEENIRWVAKLDIYINGELQTIPGGIGLEENNTAGFRTYAEDNIIYKEGPKNLTLGDFFEEWRQTFDSYCIFEYCRNSTHDLRMFVNNRINYEFEKYVVQDRDLIEIDYSKT